MVTADGISGGEELFQELERNDFGKANLWLQGREAGSPFVSMFLGADGSICCERPNVTCCSGRKGVFVQGGKVISSLASSASYTSTSVSSTPTAASGQGSSSSGEIAKPAVPSPTPAPSNPGPIAGGVVGGVAAVAVLSLAFWYFFIRHRYTGQQGIPQDNVVPYTGVAQDDHHGIARMGGNGIWQEPKEVPDAEVRRELDSNPRQELDARFGGM